MPNSKPTYDELLLENEKLRKLVLEKSDADTSGIDSHASVKDESTLKELKLESALEHLAKAVSITDKDGDLINFNTAFAKFHKYKSKEECAKTINGLFDMFEVFLPGGEPLLQEEWPVVRALRGETANNAEYLLKRIDTGEKWTCTYSFAPILDDGGKVTGSVVLCEDISECRQESQRVIKNKNRLEYALNSIETGAWELDLETLGSWRMFKHDQIFGYDKPLQEWTYDMFLEHVIPEDRDEVNQKFQHAIKTKVDWNFECRIKRNNDGQIRWIWANGNQEFNENSESIKMFGIVQDITERKQVELELKKSNELFHIAFNQQFQFMSVLSPDGRILEINELPLQKQGGKREGIIGKFFWELPTWQNSPEWQEIIKGQIKQAASMNETLLTEDVFTTEEGKVHTALASYTAICDKQNRVRYILVQATDITERKETDERLKESEEKFRAIYDNAPLSYQSLNYDGSFKDINPTWLSTLGYERNEVIGKFYKDFLHPEWQKHFEDNFPKFKKRGYVNDVQFKIRHKDGHYLDIAFEGCIGYYPDGSFKQTYCVFTDITERKKAEAELNESEVRFRSMVEQSPLSTQMFTPDGKTVLVNRAYTNLWGITLEDLDDYNILEDQQLVSNGIMSYVQRAFSGEATSIPVIEYDTVKYFGTEKKRWVQARIYPVKDNTGKIDKIILIHEDVSNRKLAEVEIQKLALVVKNSGELVNLSTVDGKMTFLNECGCKMLGIEPSELENMNIMDVIPEHLTDLSEVVLSTLINEGNWEGELQYRNLKTNELTNVHAMLFTIDNPDSGEPQFLVNISKDITERKLAEQAMKESEERFDLAVKGSNDAIWDWGNLESDEYWWSDRLYEILGYKPGEVEARISNWQKWMHPDDYDSVGEVLNKHLEVSLPYQVEFRMQKKSGDYVWVAVSGESIRDNNGKPIRMAGSLTDITDRKIAEQELAKHREHLEDLVKERTKELETKNIELERFNELFVDREFRIKELKEEIKKLKYQ